MQARPVVVAKYEGCGDSQMFTSTLNVDGPIEIDGILAGLKQVQRKVNEHLYKVASLPVPPGGEESSSDDEIRFDQSSEEVDEGESHFGSQLHTRTLRLLY